MYNYINKGGCFYGTNNCGFCYHCCYIFSYFLINYLIICSDQYNGDNIVVLSFNEFYKYYRLNPDSWIIDYDKLEKSKCSTKAKQHLYSNIRCRIKFTSYWRYYLFVRSLECSKGEKSQKEVYVSLLEEVQKDIDKCKAEAEKWNKQGVDMLEKILTK